MCDVLHSNHRGYYNHGRKINKDYTSICPPPMPKIFMRLLLIFVSFLRALFMPKKIPQNNHDTQSIIVLTGLIMIIYFVIIMNEVFHISNISFQQRILFPSYFVKLLRVTNVYCDTHAQYYLNMLLCV